MLFVARLNMQVIICIFTVSLPFYAVCCIPPDPCRRTNMTSLKLRYPEYFPSSKVDDLKNNTNTQKLYKKCLKDGVICIPNNYSKYELPNQLKATKVISSSII